MSYTRSAWKREYVFGDSHLYSFIGEDGNLWLLASQNEEGFNYIRKEDFFELIINVLRCAGIKLNEGELKKLAEELKVRLRKRPLSFKKMSADMEKKCKRRRKNEN